MTVKELYQSCVERECEDAEIIVDMDEWKNADIGFERVSYAVGDVDYYDDGNGQKVILTV